MRCFYLTSKTSWGVRAEFWLSYCSFSGWSEARDVPQSWLESYPCCFKQKIQTILLSPSLAQHVNGYFSPFFAFSPLFPSFAAFIFISGLVLYPVASGVYVKETGFLYPVSLCRDVRAGNIYGHSYQRSCKPCLPTVRFWHFVFVLVLSDVERLWLNHATTNLIREANRVSVCKSSLSLGIWITWKERFDRKSLKTAINN